MSKGINLVVIAGNVGNIEVREASGAKVARLSIATTEGGYTNKEGKAIPEETTWHKVVMWRGMAEAVERYVQKGDKLTIKGRIKNRKYTDKDNVERTEWYIDADEMELPGKPKAESAAPSQPSNNDWPW